MSGAARIPCVDLRDRLIVAAITRAAARRAGLSPIAALELATAAAELASNAVRHGGGGVVEVEPITGEIPGVEVRCMDSGSGIADLERAFCDGWSRGRFKTPDDPMPDGLGSGLGAVRRACDDVEIETGPGKGTRIVVRRYAWRPRPARVA